MSDAHHENFKWQFHGHHSYFRKDLQMLLATTKQSKKNISKVRKTWPLNHPTLYHLERRGVWKNQTEWTKRNEPNTENSDAEVVTCECPPNANLLSDVTDYTRRTHSRSPRAITIFYWSTLPYECGWCSGSPGKHNNTNSLNVQAWTQLDNKQCTRNNCIGMDKKHQETWNMKENHCKDVCGGGGGRGGGAQFESSMGIRHYITQFLVCIKHYFDTMFSFKCNPIQCLRCTVTFCKSRHKQYFSHEHLFWV